MNEESIFAEAIAIESAEGRAEFLDSACGDNLELRQAVQKLLQLSDNAGSFLEHPVLKGQAAAVVGIDPAILCGDGSTRDGQCEANESSRDPDDDITLSYLELATREDSLGRLGHYEVLNVVGKGAFGTVLRAFDTKLERIVAIKVLSQEMASKSPARKRFLREARTSAQIRHENVVSIHSVEEEPIPYLVMEYIPGRTLQKQLEERGPLDLPSVLRLGEQIADGLAAAHAQDLIHRDIKPGNILLEGDLEERIKITDFGLARTVDDASLTQSGMITGTPMYMAPEQAHGHKLDQRADLFSLGSVLYQMISGRPPFRAPTTIAVLKRVTEDTPRPIQEIIPETPNWLCKLIGHLHAKNPAERFSSAREVSELLARCAEDVQAGRIPEIPDPSKTAEETLVSVAETRPRPSEKPMQSPLVKIAAAAVILLGLLGITEATGVSKLTSTVIRLTTGSGTLVIETDDPGVKLAIDGQVVTITGGGVEELTLRPGDYKVAALKDGKPVMQELVSITRNGRTVVRMSLEPAAAIGSSSESRSATDWHGWPADAPKPASVPFDPEQAKSHQKAWAEYFGVPVDYENRIGMKFRLIPAGEFMMGSSEEEIETLLAEARAKKRPDWFLDKIPTEGPQHKVTLTTPFSMGAHQVTRGQFGQFVEATGYRTDAEEDGKGGYGRKDGQWVQAPDFLWHTNLGFETKQTDDHPVVNVSWNDAVAFCEWLSKEAGGIYRLPTEAEWEFACRAGNPGRYSFGNDESKLAHYAWYGGHGGLGTKPVGHMAPNAFGLFDMHGNVWEWCGDGFSLYNAAHVIDPVGTNRFRLRVARGGAFSTQPSAVRSARRSDGTPTTRYVVNGFRVVLDAESIQPRQDKAAQPFDREREEVTDENTAHANVDENQNLQANPKPSVDDSAVAAAPQDVPWPDKKWTKELPPSGSGIRVKLDDRRWVELNSLYATRKSGGTWTKVRWRADGELIDPPAGLDPKSLVPDREGNEMPRVTRGILMQVVGPEGTEVALDASGGAGYSEPEYPVANEFVQIPLDTIATSIGHNHAYAEVKVGQEARELLSLDDSRTQVLHDPEEKRVFVVTPKAKDFAWRLMISRDGKEVGVDPFIVGGEAETSTFLRDELKSSLEGKFREAQLLGFAFDKDQPMPHLISLQRTPYDTVRFENLSVYPGLRTAVVVSVNGVPIDEANRPEITPLEDVDLKDPGDEAEDDEDLETLSD